MVNDRPPQEMGHYQNVKAQPAPCPPRPRALVELHSSCHGKATTAVPLWLSFPFSLSFSKKIITNYSSDLLVLLSVMQDVSISSWVVVYYSVV